MIIDGIYIEVVKKNIKNLHLYIKPPDARVLITSPRFLSQKEIERFAKKHIEWIKIKRTEVLERSKAQTAASYNSGDSLMLWGKEYRIEVHSSKRFSVSIENGTANIFCPEGTDTERLERYIKEWYRTELKREIDLLLPEWEKKTGLICTAYQTKDMKTRWGSCNTKTKKLWFSLRLARLERECLEYVILHELAHTAVPNHSKAFWSLVELHMPNYRETEKKMKNIRI